MIKHHGCQPSRVSSIGLQMGGHRSRAFTPGAVVLAPIEAVGVHDLRPSGYEILRELRPCVGRGIRLHEGAKLRMRAEDQVDARARPPGLAGLPVVPRIDAVGLARLPLRRLSERHPSGARTSANEANRVEIRDASYEAETSP